MVSVADTKKINVVEMMALILNSGLNGSKDGNAMTAVFCKELKSTTPMAMATRQPTTRPNKTDNCLKQDFAKILNKIQHNKVMLPKIQLVAEPKESLPLPPPKEEAPTESKEKPMAVTTVEDTIGVMRRIQ